MPFQYLLIPLCKYHQLFSIKNMIDDFDAMFVFTFGLTGVQACVRAPMPVSYINNNYSNEKGSMLPEIYNLFQNAI